MVTRKFKIRYIVHILFLEGNAGLVQCSILQMKKLSEAQRGEEST